MANVVDLCDCEDLEPLVDGAALQRMRALLKNEEYQQLLAWVREANGSLLLSTVYPEGAPCNPSHVSEHAAIAGACVTLLKLVLRTHADDDENRKLSWREVTGMDTSDCSLVGELNKLASNVCMGRCFAGVSFRSDCSGGLMLGEFVAVRTLQYHSRFVVPPSTEMKLSFEDFSGKFRHLH